MAKPSASSAAVRHCDSGEVTSCDISQLPPSCSKLPPSWLTTLPPGTNFHNMSSSTRVPSPVRSTEPWYTKSLRSVDRNVFLSVLRTCHRKSTASSTAIREGPWAPNQPQKDYDAVVKAWRTEKGRFPCELPGLRPEDRASRIAFWSMVEDILNRTPIELVEYAPLLFYFCPSLRWEGLCTMSDLGSLWRCPMGLHWGFPPPLFCFCRQQVG